MAINNALPLKAARRELEIFLGLGTPTWLWLPSASKLCWGAKNPIF